MNKKILVFVACALLNTWGELSADEILFTRTITVDRSVNIFDTDQFDVDLMLGNQLFAPTNPVTLFDSLLVTPDDVGSVYDVLIGDPAFDVAAQRLTDAQNEFMRLVLTENQSNGLVEQRGFSESNLFLGLATPSRPDLAGANLERIRLLVEEFTLANGSNGDLGALSSGPSVNLVLNLTFFGSAVPEPSCIWLLGASLGTLMGITRNRRGRLTPQICRSCL